MLAAACSPVMTEMLSSCTTALRTADVDAVKASRQPNSLDATSREASLSKVWTAAAAPLLAGSVHAGHCFAQQTGTTTTKSFNTSSSTSDSGLKRPSIINEVTAASRPVCGRLDSLLTADDNLNQMTTATGVRHALSGAQGRCVSLTGRHRQSPPINPKGHFIAIEACTSRN